MEADLLKVDTWDKAVEGCQYVIHVASPVLFGDQYTLDDLCKPAVEGTLAILRACQKHKVKRIVITSSVASMMYNPNHQTGRLITEEDWSVPSAGRFYDQSKTAAELAVWNFMKDLPEEEKFEVVSLHPSGLTGPNMIYGDFGSGAVFAALVNNLFPGGLPVVKFPFVDVRDCARIHI
mmetsp:Transcript_23351/g.22977  ORF Transcript_23351/g.22977 Transcript_23351/m.22977 type:complete len:178 (+) Transcript_23351:214-747(+)|eukprot:CAMPEP_0170550492 /NCGR_PEP_ID=MMETSP0211-20121228/8555_1 /TAXON_ID=311385 /ORGANISM="Pseudokeronopsis sp., Strain OXSARD2" /LENGTH=177 /DNA_ID=CAMNT_0010857077 /DNA_START=135 /DNA_END=668 /DNA_ORIENTATION=+